MTAERIPRITPGLAGAPGRRSTWSSSGSASPAPASPSTPPPAGSSVLAVDAHDLAFGTSRWSSKLVHGGLRYLANGQVGVAHESAVERGILMEVTAPHLTRADADADPADSSGDRVQAAVARGGALSPATCSGAAPRTSARHPPAPRRLSATETLALAPGAARRRAARRPARPGTASSRTTPGWSPRSPARPPPTAPHVRTRARVARRHRRPRSTLRDELTGEHAPRCAPGPWSTPPASGPATSSTTSGCGPRAAPTWCCAPTRCPGSTSAVFGAGARRAPTGSSSCCRSPTGTSTSASPTSRSTGEVPDVPEPTEAEIGFLLDVVSAAFAAAAAPRRRGRRVRRAAAAARHRRRRHDRRPVPQARRAHRRQRRGDGRRRQAHDVPADGRGRRRRAPSPSAGLARRPCRTPTLPLVGAAPRAELAGPRGAGPAGPPLRHRGRAGPRRTPARSPACADDELLAPVADGIPVTLAELVFGVTHEGAADVDDLLDRRTRVGLVPADRDRAVPAAERALALAAAPRVDRDA